MIQLHLPLPPSANGIWRNVKGRTLASAKYRAWKTEALWACKMAMQGKETITGDCRVVIQIGRPRKNADLDNRIKPCLDALQSAEVIKDDNQIVFLSARWENLEGALIQIEEVET